uniref:Monothiol glutaredoxin-S10 n=1 Tax=Aegilops tauschii TaxID=37682 RepID=M8AQ31_AEGTA
MPPPCPTLCRLPATNLGLPWCPRSIPLPRLALAARRARAVAARASSSSSSPDSSFGSRMEDSVKKTLADNAVVIYSKSWCSYSMEVKGLFKRIGVDPHVIELDQLAYNNAKVSVTRTCSHRLALVISDNESPAARVGVPVESGISVNLENPSRWPRQFVV